MFFLNFMLVLICELAWCGHCQDLAPKFEALAKRIHSSQHDAKIAKIDATANKEAAQDFNVAGFPTLKFIKAGHRSEYNSGREVEQMEAFIAKKVKGTSCKEISSEKEAKDLNEGDASIIVVDSGNKKALEQVEEALSFFDHLECFSSSKSSILSVFGLEKQVFVQQIQGVKKYYEGTQSAKAFQGYLAHNKFPVVIEVTEENAEDLFFSEDGSNREILLVISPKEKLDKELFSVLKAAGQLKEFEALRIAYTTKESGMYMQIVETLKIYPEEKEKLVIIKVGEKDEMFKYLFEGEVSVENLSKFLDEYKKGNLKRHLYSEEPPQSQNGPFEVWVGSNFHSNLKENSEYDVFVFFFAPWCGFCESLHPIYDGLASKINNSGMKIKLVKVDATKNDVEGFVVPGFPTLVYIPAKNRNSTVQFEEELRTEVTLGEFIRKHASVEWKQIELDHKAHNIAKNEMETDGNPVPNELLGEPEPEAEELHYHSQDHSHEKAETGAKSGEL